MFLYEKRGSVLHYFHYCWFTRASLWPPLWRRDNAQGCCSKWDQREYRIYMGGASSQSLCMLGMTIRCRDWSFVFTMDVSEKKFKTTFGYTLRPSIELHCDLSRVNIFLIRFSLDASQYIHHPISLQFCRIISVQKETSSACILLAETDVKSDISVSKFQRSLRITYSYYLIWNDKSREATSTKDDGKSNAHQWMGYFFMKQKCEKNSSNGSTAWARENSWEPRTNERWASSEMRI